MVKIERALLSISLIVIVGGLLIEIEKEQREDTPLTKELEFYNMKFVSVDTNSVKGEAYSTYGVLHDGILELENIVYQSEIIEYFIANRSKYVGSLIYLDGEVRIKERDGYLYETQHAIYNQLTNNLEINSPFKAYQGENVVSGNSLNYNLDKKSLFGKDIKSIIYQSKN